jgi:hypothetical protein
VGERVIIPPETLVIVAVTFKRLVCRFSYALFSSLEKVEMGISMFHSAFFSSTMDKTPTHALFTQHYISLAC